ncbi:MAG: hypothetical protein AAB500_01840 [Patescibacteria group bacterium]
MMTVIFILFLVSLLGLLFMFGRKLVHLRSGAIQGNDGNAPYPPLPDWRVLKDGAEKHAKRYGYAATVTIIRSYVRSMNFLKNRSKEMAEKLENLMPKNGNGGGTGGEPKGTNKFLEMISEYKHKIRRIKREIHEEENKS